MSQTILGIVLLLSIFVFIGEEFLKDKKIIKEQEEKEISDTLAYAKSIGAANNSEEIKDLMTKYDEKEENKLSSKN